MPIISPRHEGNEEDDWVNAEIKPLTAEQADWLRERQPSVSPWRVVMWQVAVGVLVTLACFALTGLGHVAWSAAYGALAVIFPAAVFARGLTGRFASLNPGTAVLGFFLWEMVKIGLTVAMLIAAPQLIQALSWPALLVGLVVTIKVYWVAMVVAPKKKHING